MFISLPAIESAIDAHIAASRYNEALANMVVGVHNHYKQSDVAHKYLYYPRFDQQIRQLSDALLASAEPTAGRPVSDNTLIIATELHQEGGHSRVVIDAAHALESPIVVLTDTFWLYRNMPDRLNWLLDALDFLPVIPLQQRSPWAKCRALSLLVKCLQPRSILYFNHHEDPIPFIGTLGHPGSRKTLVHHCDHNPSLGNTLAEVEHVDFTDELAQTCAKHLHRATRVLPLYIRDAGRKHFSRLTDNTFSVVTCGSSIKFTRGGEMALENIAMTVLSSIRGQFFHIGQIDGNWVAEIKSCLQRNAIDPNRFVPLGGVDSLWKTIADLDAHFYLGSAPVGGGRAAIEAQGCGYPVAFFRVTDPGSLLAVDSVYASHQLGWSTLEELSALLKSVGPLQPLLSDAARSLYEQKYSYREFVRMLIDVTS